MDIEVSIPLSIYYLLFFETLPSRLNNKLLLFVTFAHFSVILKGLL